MMIMTKNVLNKIHSLSHSKLIELINNSTPILAIQFFELYKCCKILIRSNTFNYTEKELHRRCFSKNIVKFFRKVVLYYTCERVLLIKHVWPKTFMKNVKFFLGPLRSLTKYCKGLRELLQPDT